ncbi:MAG: DUF2442 domain-containing protein [Thermodesulfobacteriota bacterium]
MLFLPPGAGWAGVWELKVTAVPRKPFHGIDPVVWGGKMHFVKSVKYLDGFRLELTFEDDIVKIVDLEHHLDGEVFEPLNNIEYFKKVRINPDIDTIVWENEADFSPDFLFEIGERA